MQRSKSCHILHFLQMSPDLLIHPWKNTPTPSLERCFIFQIYLVFMEVLPRSRSFLKICRNILWTMPLLYFDFLGTILESLTNQFSSITLLLFLFQVGFRLIWFMNQHWGYDIRRALAACTCPITVSAGIICTYISNICLYHGQPRY